MIVPEPKPSPRGALGWLVLGCAIILMLGVIDSRRLPNGGFGAWTTFLLVGAPVAVLGAALVLGGGGWRRTPTAARITLLTFTALLGFATFSALTHTQLVHDRIGDLGTITAPTSYILLPLLSALVTCVLGWVLASGPPVAQLPRLISVTSWSLLGVVTIAVARMTLRGELGDRLNSTFAGASTIHLALLLGLAGFIGLARAGHARLPHLVGAAGTCIALLATGSRAGLLLAGVFLLFQVLTLPLGGRGALIRGAAVIALTVTALFLALLVPDLQERLTFVDEYRARNASTAMAAWLQSPVTILLGNGQGTLWPWTAYEHGLVPVVADWDLWTPWGPVLPSPHSTWLWAVAELGLLGFALLALTAVPPAVQGILRGDALARSLGMGLLLSLVAFTTDTHLVKVFPVALVWWITVFVVLRLVDSRDNGCMEMKAS
ncbi:MAG: hypothetical protein Q4D96_12430 [Propionibacteriaceae bacterium]|nr:hypothetical protein [Propionibacteriaceae bacterium]